MIHRDDVIEGRESTVAAIAVSAVCACVCRLRRHMHAICQTPPSDVVLSKQSHQLEHLLTDDNKLATRLTADEKNENEKKIDREEVKK